MVSKMIHDSIMNMTVAATTSGILIFFMVFSNKRMAVHTLKQVVVGYVVLVAPAPYAGVHHLYPVHVVRHLVYAYIACATWAVTVVAC